MLDRIGVPFALGSEGGETGLLLYGVMTVFWTHGDSGFGSSVWDWRGPMGDVLVGASLG